MTDNRASEWAQTFNSWKNETITNRDLIKNQTLLFESSLHYNKKTFKHIEDSFRTLQNDLKRFESSTNISISAINLKLDVQTLIQIAQLGIEEHARLYGQIRRTLSNARTGKMTELITKSQLSTELHRISSSLKKQSEAADRSKFRKRFAYLPIFKDFICVIRKEDNGGIGYSVSRSGRFRVI